MAVLGECEAVQLRGAVKSERPDRCARFARRSAMIEINHERGQTAL
jgi:hypothetical protein